MDAFFVMGRSLLFKPDQLLPESAAKLKSGEGL